MRVALFATCLGDQFFAEACADAVRLLRHVGVEVDFPADQTCCGQPAYNSGHRAEAKKMAQRTHDVLADYDYVVVPSGSCAGMIRCLYPGLLGAAGHGDTQQTGRGAGHGHGPGPKRSAADDLSARTYELAQFLVQVRHIESLGRGLTGKRVAYHHGCHALRELRVEAEPIELLRGCGAEVVPWEADRECCGFGGLFSAKLPEVSAGMADRKLDTLPAVDFVASADGGCLLQLSGRAAHRSGGVRKRRPSGRASPPPFRHLASVLWQGVDR